MYNKWTQTSNWLFILRIVVLLTSVFSNVYIPFLFAIYQNITYKAEIFLTAMNVFFLEFAQTY